MANPMNRVRTASAINAILGVWLIAAPWIYGYAEDRISSVWNSVVVGLVIAAFGSLRIGSPDKASILSWTNLALGAWMAASPWLYDYTDNFGWMWNSVVVGVVVIVLAARSANTTLTERRPQAHN